jgi:hypothetical protein
MRGIAVERYRIRREDSAGFFPDATAAKSPKFKPGQRYDDEQPESRPRARRGWDPGSIISDPAPWVSRLLRNPFRIANRLSSIAEGLGEARWLFPTDGGEMSPSKNQSCARVDRAIGLGYLSPRSCVAVSSVQSKQRNGPRSLPPGGGIETWQGMAGH